MTQNEAPEQAQLNVPDRYYLWSNGRMQIRPCDIDDHYSIEYIRSDLAEAQTKERVREVLERVQELVADPNIDEYEYDYYINNILKDYQ